MQFRALDDISSLVSHVDPSALDEVIADDFVDAVFDQETRDVGCHLDSGSDFSELGCGFEDRDVTAGSCYGD